MSGVRLFIAYSGVLSSLIVSLTTTNHDLFIITIPLYTFVLYFIGRIVHGACSTIT